MAAAAAAAAAAATVFDAAQHGCVGNAGGAAWWLEAASYRERLEWVREASQASAGRSGYPQFDGTKRLYQALMIILEGVCDTDASDDCPCGRVFLPTTGAGTKQPLWVHIGDGIKGLEGDGGESWDLPALIEDLVEPGDLPPAWSEDLARDGTTKRAGIVQKAIVTLCNLNVFGATKPSLRNLSDNRYLGHFVCELPAPRSGARVPGGANERTVLGEQGAADATSALRYPLQRKGVWHSLCATIPRPEEQELQPSGQGSAIDASALPAKNLRVLVKARARRAQVGNLIDRARITRAIEAFDFHEAMGLSKEAAVRVFLEKLTAAQVPFPHPF